MALTSMISVAQLEQILEQENLVILDSRFYLNDLTKGKKAYAAGHIPNAYFLDLHHQLAGPETPESGRHPLPEADVFAQTIADFGIGLSSQVVVYDDMGGAMAARAWWMLAQQGIAVYVLDGGYPAWCAAGLAIETEENLPVAGSDKIAVAYPWLVTEEEVVANFDADNFCLVDARAQDRFNGENETMDPVAGHIPGALNRPFTENLTTGGSMKSAELIQHEWANVLGTLERPVVYYCGSGVTACHNVLAMNHAGQEAKHIYVGSWSQWAKRIQRTLTEMGDE